MSNRQQERFRVKCERIEAETDRAILAVVDADEYGLIRGAPCELWFPLSQVHEIVRGGPEGAYLVVTPWIAGQKGLR